MAVGVSTVERREVDPSSELTGRVEATQNVEVRPHVSGYVTAVNYREGADVRKGATLFTIDVRPYQAALARATADLAGAKARADLARVQAARAEMLFAKSAMNQSDHDVALSTAAQAAAGVQAAEAAVESRAWTWRSRRCRRLLQDAAGRPSFRSATTWRPDRRPPRLPRSSR